MSGERIITRVDALRSLRITPRLFRQLVEEYREELGALPMGGVYPSQFETLRTIARMRQEGVGRDAIRARLQSAPSLDAPGPETAGGALDEMLRRISDDLRRAEDERVEDRDRLLTALIRTQQEIAHLRQELAASVPRRERKKGGFFRRLFS